MSKDNTPAELGGWLATWLQIREQLAGQIEQEDRAGRQFTGAMGKPPLKRLTRT